MSKVLVVVESPAKAKTIEKYLGKNYVVKASMGHLRDLPKSQFGIDVENNFSPKYINIRGKGDLIKSLKSAAKSADKVFLASDPDREGEAIAWHLAHILNVDEDEKCRIVFNEITKPAIQNAVKSPRPINIDRVDAQQARRMLDRIVGYKLSPLLWRKVRKGLSAGRVQSVTVKLICDREKEIQSFISEEYWTIDTKLREKVKSPMFDAELITIDGEKLAVNNEKVATEICDALEKQTFVVKEVKKRQRQRKALPPFITSSLQQDASRKLGFTSRKTMMLAQQLYEGLELGRKGPVGLITYMRTDSTRVSDLAQQEVRDYVNAEFSAEYLPEKPPVYSTKKSQDAHEAIRPTSIIYTPDSIEKYLSKDQYKLYRLIWERFVASQMAPAIYDTLTIQISAGKYGLKATGSQLKFPGFRAVYIESKEQDKDVTLPELAIDQVIKLQKVLPKQHFTEPPPRYNEASLVKTLEEKGIGRPSTYSPIIETILGRGYVVRVDKKFEPTELGFVVVDMLKEYFETIVDAEFTAGLENQLDEIAEGKIDKNQLLEEFYEPFAKTLEHAEEAIGHVELPEEISDIPCEHCGRMMVVKQGRYGKFLACPGFPECRNTKPLLKDTGVICTKCGGAIVERRSKRGKHFYGCKNYPECDFVSWDMPLKENCEVCGAFMLKHNYKNGRFITYCSNEECTSRIDHPINKELEKNKKKTQEQAEKKENADVALDNSKKSGKTKTTQKKSTKKTSRKKAEEK
ncbi:type I DNA topoisomerase [Anaerosinus gibii]|uniref:DNA topoisomerase 1 n=1 Tax=Selenobaculum gibii TaxID=3054208 RepID=A0A9Y2AKF2_9FIRM|nr:type I DNA topoisomerase [Selenobaculum gbiensis]WIW71571.1 type I DNA topoisomerase [Selenobaculum gbiensis]